MIDVCELFTSIQGESTHAGKRCAFVRLSGCNLSCSYCDTSYAKTQGNQMSIDDVLDWVETQNCRTVEITGGEPLLQPETAILAKLLGEEGHTVLVETNGSQDISLLPKRCIKIIDIKCPGSGAGDSFFIKNIAALSSRDECKFVISHREDFDWACAFLSTHRLSDICTVLFSPNHPALLAQDLAAWIIEQKVPVRLGLQLHKYIWNDARGK